ncbi:MAG: nitrilase family protein [Crocinitomicaceae bacterium]|nr:nitrilase family protein [Crocinitomicaceae bacterium]
MQNLNVALVQPVQFWEDKNANLNHLAQLISNIHEPVHLVVLPEMFQTGFTMNVKAMAEPINGESVTWLTDQARQFKTTFIASLIINENDHYYNRLVMVDENGVQAHYDKIKLFSLAREDQHFSAGEQSVTVNVQGWNIRLQICYDLRFPELARNTLVGDAFAYDILLNIANWPAKRSHHWKTLLTARAIENQCYVIAVNRVGTDANGLNYSGDSVCINSNGEAQWLTAEQDQVAIFNLDYEALQQFRKQLPFLKDA